MRRFSFTTILAVCIIITLVIVFFIYQNLGHKEQDLMAHMSGLEKQIEALKSEAKEDPGDQSSMLEGADQSLAKLLTEKEKLSEEHRHQQESYLKLDAELLKYQKDYPITEQ